MECESWPEITLLDIADIRHGFAFKGEYFSEVPQPFVLTTPGNFSVGGGFQVGKPKYYAGPVPEDYVLSSGDLLVTMTDLSKASDTLGFGAVVPTTQKSTYLHNQRVGLVRVNRPDAVSRKWLHYLLRSNAYRAWVLGSASGTTVKHTSPSRICSYRFRLPPLDEQERVAALLDSLQGRIDLLRETNTTLEAIAQTMFKSWFVDFGPVRAKAEGREPEGMDAATAALFPSEFEESELGLIPRGWSVCPFGVLGLLTKGTVSPMGAPDAAFDHYSLPAFDVDQLPKRELGAEIKSNKTPVPSGSVLISKLNPHIPRIWFVGHASEHAVCSTEFLVWTPSHLASAELLYCLATSAPFGSLMCQLVNGTSNSHQRVKPDQLASIPVVAAPAAIADAFATSTQVLFQKLLTNRLQATSLANLRDTLLPRLISGKLRLPEAEAAIAEALA